MFSWRVSTYAQQTPVDAILDKGHVVLEDLLEIDDLAKEARVLNGRLMTYLKKQDTLRQLLEYLVGRPPTAKAGQQRSQEQADARTKHSLAACEVLCSLAEEVPGALAGNNELLHLLFSATGSPTSLDCALAGYFARLVGLLLTRCAEQMLAFLEATRGILDSLLEHLDTAGMAETFVRIVGADEQAVPNLPSESLAWLSEMDIIARLLARLDEDAKSGAHGNVAEVLAAIARSRSSPLTRQLCEASNLNSLIGRAVVPPPQVPSVQALNIYIALLERRRLLATVGRTSADASAVNTEADANLSKVIAAMVPHTPTLAHVLSTAHSTISLETSYGMLRPPLGSVRLTVIELVAVLLRTGSEEAEAAIIASGIVREILAVFLRFPFNSILHHQVTSIVACMLEAGSNAIVGHLFGDCDLLGWLLNAPAQCETEQRPGDTRERAPLRAGYMGHLTEIANSLQTVAARRPPVAQLLCSSTAWTDFAFGPLAERNQLEDVLSWRCGHPQMRSVAPAAAKDGDTEMPDLQLDALANLERHAGRYSAFSDDEDEDELHSLYLDASGDSDLWDLAAAESGEAIQRHGSPSPFASRSLLGSFDMEDDRDASWMRRPSLLAAVDEREDSCPSLAECNGDALGGQSSPPSTWEDRIDFESTTSWMDSDDMDEDGTVLTASPGGGTGTPDLLADSPPDAPSPNAARVTPRVLFPALQPPVTEITAPAAAGSPQRAQEAGEDEPHSPPGSRSEWTQGREIEKGLSGERVLSPVGCYSTLASHQRGAAGGGGHELPACFASPPTSPPLTARNQHPDIEAMDTISLADPPLDANAAAGGAEHGQSERLEAASGAADPGSDGVPAKPAGMAGLRDLFAPVGGLFKGAFAASSQPPLAAPVGNSRDEVTPLQHDIGEEDAAGEESMAGSAKAADDNEQHRQSAPTETSELTRALSTDALCQKAASQQDRGQSCSASSAAAAATSVSAPAAEGGGSGASSDLPAAVEGGAAARAAADIETHGMQGMIPGASLGTLPAPKKHGGPSPDLAQADALPHAEEQLPQSSQSVGGGVRSAVSSQQGSMHTATDGPSKSVTFDQGPNDKNGRPTELPSVETQARSSTGDLHRAVSEAGAHPLTSDNTTPSSNPMDAPTETDPSAEAAPCNPADRHFSDAPVSDNDAASRSMHDGSANHPAKPPFRGRHRRWAETDAVLVPRGESEEETLVGSFTKLLVSQDDDFPEGRGAAGRRGRLSLSCAQQAPKASHPPAVEREWPE